MSLMMNFAEKNNSALGLDEICTDKLTFDTAGVDLLELYERNKNIKAGCFIFEMPYGQDRISVVCCEALYSIQIYNDSINVFDSDSRQIYGGKGDPLDFLRNMGSLYENSPEGIDEIAQSVFTLISYDAARQFEKKKLNRRAIARRVPDFWALVPKTVIIVNNTTGEGLFYLNSTLTDYTAGTAEIILNKLLSEHRGKPRKHRAEKASANTAENAIFNYTEEEFCEKVEKAQEYIKAGDIFQVVLSVECAVKTEYTAEEIYRNMLRVNNGTANYLIQSEDFSVIGASPEILVEKTGKECIIKPLAGTKLHQGARDAEIEKELLGSDKDCAEHRMLVDLARNDLGRVCSYNTVVPRKLMEVEYYYNVMHIVSEIKGLIQADKDSYDLFRASFPAGTMAGAPKIRAMEIIDELENTIRGFYSGGVGFFTASGNLYTYIVIRSLTLIKDIAYARAGAGIVYDSIPDQEYQECLSKLKNALKALQEVN